MHIYLIRHADPDYQNDSLTGQGKREANALAKKLSGHGIDYIYSSDAGRAVETAGYIADAVGKNVNIRPWLMEPSYLKVAQKGQEYVIWDTFGETVRSAEEIPGRDTWLEYPPFTMAGTADMWREFRDRSNTFVSGHGYARTGNLYRISKSNRDRIAVVCHNGIVLMFLAHLLELPLSLVWSGFFIWPSSVTTIYFEEQSDEWAAPRALNVADTSHIFAEGLEPQPRGMGPGRYEAYL